MKRFAKGSSRDIEHRGGHGANGVCVNGEETLELRVSTDFDRSYRYWCHVRGEHARVLRLDSIEREKSTCKLGNAFFKHSTTCRTRDRVESCFQRKFADQPDESDARTEVTRVPKYSTVSRTTTSRQDTSVLNRSIHPAKIHQPRGGYSQRPSCLVCVWWASSPVND